MNASQKRRAEYRSYPYGYYHLCADGWKGGSLFNSPRQFASGMNAVALAVVIFRISIFAFELMHNHFHIIIGATGATCIKVFDFIMRRIRRQLKRDGDPLPPAEYDFRLIAIQDVETLRRQIIYTIRNPYEKGLCVPGGYLWGSGYLMFSQLGEYIRGARVDSLSVRQLRKAIGSKVVLPGDWEIHPELGVLPRSFVKVQKANSLFPSTKAFLLRLVKDFEAYVHIAKSLGEELELSDQEAAEIVYNQVERIFPGRRVRDLSAEDRCRVAAMVHQAYSIAPGMLASVLGMPERVVVQVLSSKEYGVRRSGR